MSDYDLAFEFASLLAARSRAFASRYEAAALGLEQEFLSCASSRSFFAVSREYSCAAQLMEDFLSDVRRLGRPELLQLLQELRDDKEAGFPSVDQWVQDDLEVEFCDPVIF